MGKATGFSILAGLLSAGLLLLTATGSLGAIMLAYLTPLPLFYAGLTFGLPGALIAVATSTAASAVIGWLAGGAFLAFFALPVLVLVRQALLARPGPDGAMEWYPPGLLVAWLGGLGVGLLALGMLAAGGSEGGLPGVFARVLEQAFQAWSVEGEPGEVAAELSTSLPAVMAVSWMVMLAVNGALAQGLAVRFGQNLRPSPDFAGLELPRFGVAALALAAVLAWLPGLIGFFGATLLAIVAGAYFFQGLAVIHALARRSQWPLALLVGFYGLLLFIGVPALLVAALGLIEEWAHFRRRGAGPGTGPGG